MAFYEWGDNLSVSIPSIDRQHKKLIGYINSLAEAIDEGQSRVKLEGILKGLVSYTKTHFVFEEMLFERYEYADRDNHMKAHEQLFTSIEDFKQRISHGDAEYGSELMEFLKSWLNDHILREDKAYMPTFLENGVE